MSRFVSYASRELMMVAAAGIIAGQLQEHVDKSGRATLAVPGGTTPGPLFDALATADIDWASITVMLTDERWVSEGSARSNTALVRARLITGFAAAASFIGFAAVEKTPELGLARLSAAIKAHLPLSVCVLGMGSDMHTASLFPGADRLLDALSESAPPLLPMRAPGATEPRLSLTAPVLRGAAHVHILLTGQDKKAALAQAEQAASAKNAPVRVVLDQADIHWSL